MPPRKKAIPPAKDKAARAVDKKSAKRLDGKRLNKPITKETMLREAAEYAKSEAHKSRAKKRAHKTKIQRNDDILGLLEVEAIEKCVEGVEEYYKNVTYLGDTDNMTIDEVMFSLEFIKSNFNMQLAGASVQGRGNGVHTESSEDPEFYNQCTVTARRYLGKLAVREFIQQQINQRIERLLVTSDWVYKKYVSWSNLDISKIIKIKKVKGKRIIVLRKDIKNLPLEVRTAITSISVTTMGDIKIEFVNQKSALDQLCKLMAFTDDGKNKDTDIDIHLHFDKQDENA